MRILKTICENYTMGRSYYSFQNRYLINRRFHFKNGPEKLLTAPCIPSIIMRPRHRSLGRNLVIPKFPASQRPTLE
jgi:hypothetical protein